MAIDLLDAPRSAISVCARDLVHATCDAHVADHCERSYRFAVLLASLDGVTLDLEALYVGTLMHDVGLAPGVVSPDRFEARGANTARALVLDAGWDRHRADNVWDIVALHTSTGLARHKSPEACYANRGIALDIRGGDADLLAADDVARVLAQWPRAGFARCFEQSLVDEVRANPSTTRLTWLEGIAATYVDGYRTTDFLAGLHANPLDPDD